MVSKNATAKLNSIVFKGNSHTNYYLRRHAEAAAQYNKDMFVDIFKKIDLLDEKKLNRTLFVEKVSNLVEVDLINYFKAHKVGFVLNVRGRAPKKYPTVKKSNDFWLVEFAHPLSVDKALILGSQNKNEWLSKKFKMYKSGSSTFYFDKNMKAGKFLK